MQKSKQGAKYPPHTQDIEELARFFQHQIDAVVAQRADRHDGIEGAHVRQRFDQGQHRSLVAQGVDLNALDLDHHFCGWDGRVVISLTGAAPPLELHADAGFPFLNIYSPKDADFYCLEPVSHIADALNLSQQGRSTIEVGGRILAAGEVMESVWNLRI